MSAKHTRNVPELAIFNEGPKAQCGTRLSVPVRAILEDVAFEHGRTLSAEIAMRVRRTMEDDGLVQPSPKKLSAATMRSRAA